MVKHYSERPFATLFTREIEMSAAVPHVEDVNMRWTYVPKSVHSPGGWVWKGDGDPSFPDGVDVDKYSPTWLPFISDWDEVAEDEKPKEGKVYRFRVKKKKKVDSRDEVVDNAWKYNASTWCCDVLFC
ncbi:MAG: hypothetical protein U5N86_13465 [Planctomycetota bacterium]|nr:hypothetical protein [Planctomycetota bacterium]